MLIVVFPFFCLAPVSGSVSFYRYLLPPSLLLLLLLFLLVFLFSPFAFAFVLIFILKNKNKNKKAKAKGKRYFFLTEKKEWHARRFNKERGRRTRMVRVSHF